MKRLAVVALVVAAFGLAACGGGGSADPTPAPTVVIESMTAGPPFPGSSLIVVRGVARNTGEVPASVRWVHVKATYSDNTIEQSRDFIDQTLQPAQGVAFDVLFSPRGRVVAQWDSWVELEE